MLNDIFIIFMKDPQIWMAMSKIVLFPHIKVFYEFRRSKLSFYIIVIFIYVTFILKIMVYRCKYI